MPKSGRLGTAGFEPPLIDYLAPLIVGEMPITYQNGLPVYMDVSHLSKH